LTYSDHSEEICPRCMGVGFLDTAEDRRDKALAQVEDNAGPTWTELAHEEVRKLDPRRCWTGEQIRLHIEDICGKPHHHNAWGAIISSAVKADVLQATGEWRKMQTPKSHARKTPVYRRAV